MTFNHSRIARTENDTRELRMFSQFLLEMGAHTELERTIGRKLPLNLATLPESYWNPPRGSKEGRDG